MAAPTGNEVCPHWPVAWPSCPTNEHAGLMSNSAGAHPHYTLCSSVSSSKHQGRFILHNLPIWVIMGCMRWQRCSECTVCDKCVIFIKQMEQLHFWKKRKCTIPLSIQINEFIEERYVSDNSACKYNGNTRSTALELLQMHTSFTSVYSCRT